MLHHVGTVYGSQSCSGVLVYNFESHEADQGLIMPMSLVPWYNLDLETERELKNVCTRCKPTMNIILNHATNRENTRAL